MTRRGLMLVGEEQRAEDRPNTGFTAVPQALRTRAVGDVAEIPLFTPDLIALMGDLLPPEQHAQVAMTVTVSAHQPLRTGVVICNSTCAFCVFKGEAETTGGSHD